MKSKILVIFLLCFLLCSQHSVYAADYVLPYPSAMPGGITYKMHVMWEKMLQYWYIGNLAQFEYNLKESDKYLVEAKTLFEYNQLLLGYNALEKSDYYFTQTGPRLKKAASEGKNITEFNLLFKEASLKHIQTLEKMETETPAEFLWKPEKTSGTSLNIHAALINSITLRKNI